MVSIYPIIDNLSPGSDILLPHIGEVSTALIEQALRPTLGLRTADGSQIWVHMLEWLLEPRYADAVDERVRWFCCQGLMKA